MVTPQDMAVTDSLIIAMKTLKEVKPNDRSEKDRRYAVTITELEKVIAYFQVYAIGRD